MKNYSEPTFEIKSFVINESINNEDGDQTIYGSTPNGWDIE